MQIGCVVESRDGRATDVKRPDGVRGSTCLGMKCCLSRGVSAALKTCSIERDWDSPPTPIRRDTTDSSHRAVGGRVSHVHSPTFVKR